LVFFRVSKLMFVERLGVFSRYLPWRRHHNHSIFGFNLLDLFDIRVAGIGTGHLAGLIQVVFRTFDLIGELIAVIGIINHIGMNDQTVFVINHVVNRVTGMSALWSYHDSTLRIRPIDATLFTVFGLGASNRKFGQRLLDRFF
jgi:hypothetical protein